VFPGTVTNPVIEGVLPWISNGRNRRLMTLEDCDVDEEPLLYEAASKSSRPPFLFGIDGNLIRGRGPRERPIQAFSFSAAFRPTETVKAFHIAGLSPAPLMVG